jgi:hypothetical protein
MDNVQNHDSYINIIATNVEILITIEVVKIYLAKYGIAKFITMFTTACYYNVLRTSTIQIRSSYPIISRLHSPTYTQMSLVNSSQKVSRLRTPHA